MTDELRSQAAERVGRILQGKWRLDALIGVGGTRRVYEFAHQLDHDAVTGVGSARLQHEYRAAPDEVRRLKVGQCFAIGSGLAMKLQIAAAPNLTGANLQPSQPADPDLQAR